ncbi:hypothetical protein EDB84DRAFT_500935 [Lactarius hengduanensis]|nr:hypothetical protein EDB84DRAFT_500935 [Lactarius hengduanensis]
MWIRCASAGASGPKTGRRGISIRTVGHWQGPPNRSHKRVLTLSVVLLHALALLFEFGRRRRVQSRSRPSSEGDILPLHMEPSPYPNVLCSDVIKFHTYIMSWSSPLFYPELVLNPRLTNNLRIWPALVLKTALPAATLVITPAPVLPVPVSAAAAPTRTCSLAFVR